MERDAERLTRIQRELERAHVDAVICTLPANVLLVTGYWPVIGSAVAVATRDGQVGVVTPEDEHHLAADGWADAIRTFAPGSLADLRTVIETVRQPLQELVRSLGVRGTIGIEQRGSFEPSSYAAMFQYGGSLTTLIAEAVPGAAVVDATAMLATLRGSLTSKELELVRRACAIAREAFTNTAADIRIGMRECEIAALLRSRLSCGPRADGFAYCMSGQNAARADAAYQQSTTRAVAAGDCVLLHCNSYCGGFWTDITRTFTLGEPSPLQISLYHAVLTASGEAVHQIHPGIRAADVDATARRVMDRQGYGEAFTHGTGHAVGFAAINHNAPPRLHPKSDDVLTEGMVFNVEPGAYFAHQLGIRHCDMVAVHADGAELLTPFLRETHELWLFCH